MLILIVGGAASGKSALGERICAHRGGRLAYIATMEPQGAEAEARIKKHRAQRLGKGFETVERYYDLECLDLPGHWDGVLLECVGNLLANEQFGRGVSPDRLRDKLVEGIVSLERCTHRCVVISNDIFGGAERYTGEMAAYQSLLGAVNRSLARRAAVVIESVSGLPVFHKGSPEDLK